MNTRTALQRVAAQSFPDEDRLRSMVPEAERARRLHRILDDRRLHPVPDPAPRGRRWGSALVVGVAVVAVLAAVALFVLPGAVGERPLVGPANPVPDPTATTAPTEVLLQLAALAEARPPAAAGRFDYVHTLTSPSELEVRAGEQAWTESELWVDDTGSGRIARSGPDGDSGSVGGEDVGITSAPVDLPADPDPLDRYLRDKPQGLVDDPGPYLAVRFYWANQVVEPATEAALLRLLAAGPDTRVIGPVTDRAGRGGLEVRVTEKKREPGFLDVGPHFTLEHRFVFDQGTGALLSFDLIVLEGESIEAPKPLSLGATLLLGSGRVDSLWERP